MVGGEGWSRQVVGGKTERGRVGGGENEWWEAKLSEGDEWREVEGGKRQK